MSESSEHRDLVMLMACELRTLYPNIVMTTDVQMKPGEPIPPVIDGHRPDIYAHYKDESFCLIGEAKTVCDLENKHTYSQITSFVQHLESRLSGCFILGISGEKADRAKTLLRFIHKKLGLLKTSLQVFDGCDYWTLDRKEGMRWHLS